MKISFFKLANSTVNFEDKHSSEEVSKIISLVKEMVAKGAPNEHNNLGFGKLDYSNPIINFIDKVPPNSSLSWKTIFESLRILKKYKNTQLQDKNLDLLESELRNQLSKKFSSISSVYEQKDKKIIKRIGPGSYGKDLYFIGQLSIDEAKELVQFLSSYIEKEKQNNPELYSKFGPDPQGKPQIFKAFTKQAVPDLYEIHPLVANILKNNLKEKGYLAEDIQDSDLKENKKTFKSLNVVKREINNYEVSFQFDQDLVNQIKSLPFSERKYNPDNRSWILINPSKSFLKKLAEISNLKGFDGSKFDEAISLATDKAQSESQESSGKIKITCRDISDITNNNWLISLNYLGRNPNPSMQAKIDAVKSMFNETIKFCLVNYTDNINNNDPDIHTYIGSDPRFQYQRPTRGDLNDYSRFIQCCKTLDLDTIDLEQKVSGLVNRGIIERERIDGEIDGFEHKEEFKQAVNPFEERFKLSQRDPNLKINDLQLHGMQFLYSRKSALLGDQTGTGKTVQSIIAAQLRLMRDNEIPFGTDLSKPENYRKIRKKCLVFTMNSVVNQFSDNISNITGIPRNKISNNWLDEDSPWKVLSYNTLSSKESAIEATKFLRSQAQNGEYAICILDECHNVKNGSPSSKDQTGNLNHKSNKQTFNCQEITQYIPFVWGLSATIIANKPIDIYNQLRVVNHPLGKLNYKSFKVNFDPPTKSEAEKFANADRLRKILIMQRLYIQRTKKMMREDMPNILIEEKNASINYDLFNRKAADRLSGYKKEIPITVQIAIRTELAISKVPETLKFAQSIIDQGKKVAIFTDFGESFELIVKGLRAMLSASGGQVAEVRGKQTADARDAIVRSFKSPTSPFKAIVINIAAGGTGIDLPNILTDVIFNDYDWSPARDEQARGRFYRINSKSDVHTHYMIAGGTPDEAIFDKVKTKIRIMERIQKLDEEQINRIVEGKYDINSDDMEKNELQVQLQEIDENLESTLDDIIRNNLRPYMDGEKQANRKSWFKLARK